MGLMSRYPELSFITTVIEYEEKEIEWECAKKLGIEIPSTPSVLYVYGCSPHIEPIHNWLNADRLRDVVFIEDDLARIAKLQEEGHDTLFDNDRMHLRLIMDKEPLDVFAETLVAEFPFENIAFASLKGKEERFEKLRLLIMRKSVVIAAASAELLYSQTLYKNIRANLPLLSEAADVALWKDAFKGMPAVICGAGPSLAGVKGQIEAMKGHGLIFAGGSAITALSTYQILPDLLFAIDPNHEEFIRLALHTAFDIPLIYGNRLQPDVLQASVGDLGYFVSNTGGEIETFFEEELGVKDAGILSGLSDEALSVTSVAIKCAIYFGCSPIIFAGIDLSYKEGARYAPGVVSDMQCALEENSEIASETLMQKDGRTTMAKWLMERDVIQDIIEKNKETQFIDGTGEGLLFDGIEVSRKWKSNDYPTCDIKGMIHDLSKTSKLSISKNAIEESIARLQKSFDKCHEIITDILAELATLDSEHETREDTPKEIVFEMDLEEEIAYKVALRGAAYAWTFYIKKSCSKEEEKRKTFFIKKKLYRKLQTLVEEYQRIC